MKMLALRSVAALVFLFLPLAACVVHTTEVQHVDEPAQAASPASPTAPAPAGLLKPVVTAPGSAAEAKAPPARQAQACSTDADCTQGGTCEGKGCGPGEGRCVPKRRICTRDLRPYCGCDGVTFRSSGTCPGKRFAHLGACSRGGVNPFAAGKGASGSSCRAAADCASGICEGQGCGPNQPGRCADPKRVCTADMAEHCGCDGKTFMSSSSCPGRRYARRGACKTRRAPTTR